MYVHSQKIVNTAETIFWLWTYMMMVITEIRRVDNLLTMSVHDDGYYRNTLCWQSFDYERTWWWLLQKSDVLTIFWLWTYMMMVITEIRRISVITIIMYVHSQKIVNTADFCNNHHHARSWNAPCWQSFDYERTWWWLLQKYAVLTIFWLWAYMMMVITEIRGVCL
jgi:hypothetical protein